MLEALERKEGIEKGQYESQWYFIEIYIYIFFWGDRRCNTVCKLYRRALTERSPRQSQVHKERVKGSQTGTLIN